MSTQVTPQFLYNLFSNIYYEQEYPQYSNKEIGTHETTQCLLKSFMQRRLNKRLLNEKIVILTMGRMGHLMLQQELEKHDYAVEVEKPYEMNNLTLYTHTDALHDTHTLEIKFVSRLPDNILPQHYYQANTYTVVHKKLIGYVTYIQKPSGIIKVYPYKPDNEAFKYVIMRALGLSGYLNKNQTPPPEPSWLCRYCEYIDTCPSPQKTYTRRGAF